MLHTILGAGGSIGNPLVYELLKHNQNVRLFSRSGFKIEGTEIVKGDLGSYEDTLRAVKGSDVVHLCAGLAYNYKVWQEQWPVIMQNTINACKSAGSKLIFFDNVYMYGKVDGKMTETTPYNPCSKKGEVRAKVALQLEQEFKSGNLSAIIARAADLYGPYATKTSVPFVLAINNLMKGKSAKWLGNASTHHSYTYTLDCSRSLHLLANNNEAYNQVWHLPTCNPGIDGKTFIEIAASELGVKPNYSVLKKWMIKAAGLFDKTIYELYEMLYQSEFDYYFDSTKFENFFQYKPLSYQKGIKETIEFLKSSGVNY